VSAEHQETGRARRRILPVLSALAVLAVSGGAGYALSSLPGQDDDRPPPLRLSGAGAAAAVAAGAAPAVEYLVSGSLPDGPGEAPVYRLADRPLDAAAVRPLAEATGVAGAPRQNADAWVAGGTGVMLRVGKHAGQRWSTTAMGAASVECLLPSRKLDRRPAVTSCPPRLAAPSPAQATARARPVFEAVGLDAGTASTVPGGSTVTLTVDPTVDSRPTSGFSTTATVDARRVVSASGWLGRPEAGAEYPVITAEQAVAELRKRPPPIPVAMPAAPVMGVAPPGTGWTRSSARAEARLSATASSVPGSSGAASSGAAPPRAGSSAGSAGAGSSPVLPTAGPEAPAPKPLWRPTKLTVQTARFGYSLQMQDGEPLLVPSWLFDLAQPRTTVAQVAVDPRYLDPAGTATNDPEPARSPSRNPDDPASDQATPAPGSVPPAPPTGVPPAPPPGAEPAPGVPSGPFNGLTRITAAKAGGDGRTLTLTVDGGPAAGPCRTTYQGWAKTDASRVWLAVQGDIPQAVDGVRCRTSGIARTVAVRLDAPAGGRTLMDSSTGQPVPR
jgi:hypothetical protein